MKLLKYIFTLLMLSVTCWANAQNINALFSYATFYNPQEGPYIETYLSVEGTSVKYIQNNNNKWQATVLVTLIFKQGDKIVSFKKNCFDFKERHSPVFW